MNRAMKMALALCMALWLVVPAGGMAGAVPAGRPYPSSVTVTYGDTVTANLFTGDTDLLCALPAGVYAITVEVVMSRSGYPPSDNAFPAPLIMIDGSISAIGVYTYAHTIRLTGTRMEIPITLVGTGGFMPPRETYTLTVTRAPQSAGASATPAPTMYVDKANTGICRRSTNVYAGAGEQYDVVDRLRSGTEIELSQWYAGGTWCRVFYNDGKNNGWIPAKNITPQ